MSRGGTADVIPKLGTSLHRGPWSLQIQEPHTETAIMASGYGLAGGELAFYFLRLVRGLNMRAMRKERDNGMWKSWG